MIRFKKDETPTPAAPAVVKTEAAKTSVDAVGAAKTPRPKASKAQEGSPKSAELFLPAEELDAE
jgi:hypothetical protein